MLVVGAGAIGQWLGSRLQEAGLEVVLQVRAPLVAPLKDLRIQGHTTWQGPMRAAVRPEGPFDVAIVTCKAHATAEAALQAAQMLAPDGVLASLQNGLGNGQKLAAAWDPERVVLAITSHGVAVEAPGRLHHAGTGATHVGPFIPEGRAAAKRVHGLLERADLEPALHEDLKGHIWLKAIVNSALNPVAAVAGCRNGQVLEDPALWGKAQELVEEGVALSRAVGVALPGDPLAALRGTLERTAENRCSMLQDVEARRPTELEQITGRFVRIARRLGYPMVRTEEVYREAKALETSYLGEKKALDLVKQEVLWEPRWEEG